MTKRITSLYKKRGLLNRISWYIYDKLCGEPYIPDGKVSILVKSRMLERNNNEGIIRITFIPKKFIPGIHEWYIFDRLCKNGDEITFTKNYK